MNKVISTLLEEVDLKVDEQFYLGSSKDTFVFRKDGNLYVVYEDGDINANSYLNKVVYEADTIIKKIGRFFPNYEEEYYYISNDYNSIKQDFWSGDEIDVYRSRSTILFKTKEECEDYRDFLKELLRYSHRYNPKEDFYYLSYNLNGDEINFTKVDVNKTLVANTCYFGWNELCKFYNKVGERRIKKYLFDIWD